MNATDSSICEVHLATQREHLWGPSWISEPVSAGEQVVLPVRPDDYMIRVGDCRLNTKVVAYRVPVEGDVAIVIHDGYPSQEDPTADNEVELPSWNTDQRGRMLPPGAVDDGIDFHVMNQCALDLRVVLGGDPEHRSGWPSTLPAHARLRYLAPAGTELWLVDADYHVLASTEIDGQSHQIDVAPTCDRFTAA